MSTHDVVVVGSGPVGTAIARVLVKQGYTGFVSSEYEAHAYTDRYSGFDQVRAHHDMLKRLLESA